MAAPARAAVYTHYDGVALAAVAGDAVFQTQGPAWSLLTFDIFAGGWSGMIDSGLVHSSGSAGQKDGSAFSFSAEPVPYVLSVRAPDDLLYPFSGSATAQASGSAGFGSLHARASIFAIATPTSYTVFDKDDVAHFVPNPIGLKASARATVSFADVVHVTSGTLDAGTPVRLRLTGQLHGSQTPPSYDMETTFVHAAYHAGDQQIALSLDEPAVTSASVEFRTTIGATLDVTGLLQAEAGATAQAGVTPSNPYLFNDSGDAANTASLFLDPVTAGVTLVSDSGTSYATPVPEPATLTVIAVGAVLLTRARRASNRAKSLV